MSLEINRAELERLLELAYLGEWLMNSQRDVAGESALHLVTFQKLLKLADESGLGYLVETDEATGELRPSKALEARMELAHYVQDYDDAVFWDELAIRLAERDLAAEIGKEAFDRLPHAEREARVNELARRWDAELDEHGVDRLQLPEGTRRARPKSDRLTEKLRRLFDDSR